MSQENLENLENPETLDSNPESEILEENMEPEVEIIEEPEAPVLDEDKMKALLAEVLAQQEDKYLRLAAEYDNFRKRSQKEKQDAYQNAKSDAVEAFLPVYDNLERALQQETADEAYKKGVEMTMTQLKAVLEKEGITEIPALGETFDPNCHNAIMHIENPELGENVVSQVFQAGFQMGDKIVRFAMVQVAN